MKVRWTDGSLRVRITPSELDALAAERPVVAALGAAGCDWRVTLSPGGDRLSLRAAGAALTITLGADALGALGDAGSEGVYGTDAGVRLIVEKDFPCAHPHPADAEEPETERFTPTPAFRARRAAS